MSSDLCFEDLMREHLHSTKDELIMGEHLRSTKDELVGRARDVVAERDVADRQGEDQQPGLQPARECGAHQNLSGATRAMNR